MASGAEAGGIEPHPSGGTIQVSTDDQSHLVSTSRDLRNFIIT